MIKTYCDICSSEKEVFEVKILIDSLKERLGECGLYKTICGKLHFFGKDYKPIKHICTTCGDKILGGASKYYEDLFYSFFEEPKPVEPSAEVIVQRIIKELNSRGYDCKY